MLCTMSRIILVVSTNQLRGIARFTASFSNSAKRMATDARLVAIPGRVHQSRRGLPHRLPPVLFLGVETYEEGFVLPQELVLS
jgi:hypothetical protein